MNKSIEDFSIGLTVFKDNLRAYLSVVLFVIISAFGIVLLGVGTLGFVLLLDVLGINLSRDVKTIVLLLLLIVTFIGLMITIVFSAFNATLYGLSYDIMSSGDLHTEFRKAFSYFRRNWFSYLIFSLPLLLTSMIYQFIDNQLTLFLGTIVLDYITILIISGCLTSVTANEKFFYSFKQSLKILKKDFLRIALTIGLYFIIFRTPYIVSIYISKLGLQIDFLILFLLIMNFILMLFSSLIGNPILSIIATRIYNTNVNY